jgi:S1-C subfamily serine protease
MRTQKTFSLFRLVPVVFLVSSFCVPAAAQTPAPKPRVASRVIVENKATAPQVVTILHSLNGLKVFRLLIRSKEQVEAIERLDEAFNFAGEVHTNVIAGLALDDGNTIAAWLPEAEAEMPPPAISFAPRAPAPPASARTPGAGPAPKAFPPPGPGLMAMPGMPSINFQGNLLEAADLRIITRDGRRIMGRYLGLDGLTGLSLISLTGAGLPQSVDSKEQEIVVGQQLRVIGPQPASRPEVNATNAPNAPNPRGAMYIRIGETEATVINVSRSPSGSVARVKIKSAKLSPANIGGIAINDKGQTLGIVDAVEGNEATIVPVALVRMAAKRVLARQASVPRPWLGIRGEPVGALSLERILRDGWQIERARSLTEKRQGILLTWVAPGSPAALAKLKPGDVILTVNKGYVRNADDFSSLLDEADSESPVLFTVARPGKNVSEAMEIKLSESPDPWFGLRTMEKHIERVIKPGSLMAEGIETIALKPRAASRLGSSGGLLVVYVQPTTDAFKAGLRAGDIIETIDGEPVFSSAAVMTPKPPGVNSTCVVVRDREKIVLTFKYSTNHYHKP